MAEELFVVRRGPPVPEEPQNSNTVVYLDPAEDGGSLAYCPLCREDEVRRDPFNARTTIFTLLQGDEVVLLATYAGVMLAHAKCARKKKLPQVRLAQQ